jgi:hypothetical protein
VGPRGWLDSFLEIHEDLFAFFCYQGLSLITHFYSASLFPSDCDLQALLISPYLVHLLLQVDYQPLHDLYQLILVLDLL